MQNKNSKSKVLIIASMLAPIAVFILSWILMFAVFGHWIGFWIGLIFGIIVGFVAIGVSAHYPIDLHGGKILEFDLAPDTYNHVKNIANELGIDPPSLYLIEIDTPQICVSASGLGKHARGKIGVTKTLIMQANDSNLFHLLALACTRIVVGQATVASVSAALGGIPLQVAMSNTVNFQFTPKWVRNSECGLTPLGIAMLILSSPNSLLMASISNQGRLITASDRQALRLSWSSSSIAEALEWLSSVQVPIIGDPVSEFNPAEAPLYLISPFDSDHASQPAEELPLWKKMRMRCTSNVPSLARRLELLRAEQWQEPKVRLQAEARD